MNHSSNYSVTKARIKQVLPVSSFAEHALAVAHAYSKKEYPKKHMTLSHLNNFAIISLSFKFYSVL